MKRGSRRGQNNDSKLAYPVCFQDRQGHKILLDGPIRINEIVCGNNHTVALDDTGVVYTWGFGGYGRLGHADNVG